jgi:SAM-dependent methyltransferase
MTVQLLSPDDGTLLREDAGSLIDAEGNRYPLVNGVLDLRPKNPISGILSYNLVDHRVFRSYEYQRSLSPIFSHKLSVYLELKELNILPFIPPPHVGAVCLDHGCGAGSFRRLFESLGYAYVGVDNESGTTTEQGGGHGFQGGATHLCDLHRLPFDRDTFQFAVSYSVFEHLQNPFLAARELYRVMEPGGIGFIAVAAAIPFHMDSFYHHTHYGVLSTFLGAGFTVRQIAGANWNAYHAISSMDGLPGPRFLRIGLSNLIYASHRALWHVRARVKKRDLHKEELRRHLMMSGIIKAIIEKPST